MTRVIHIQYSTSSAGSAALRLQNAFIKENIESNIISLFIDNKNTYEGISYLGSIPRRIAWIDYKLQSFLTTNNNKNLACSPTQFWVPMLHIWKSLKKQI